MRHTNATKVKNVQTAKHISLLAYDGDPAGILATLKTGYNLIKGGIEAQV